MAEEGFKRKLSAILSADVKGYSRLMDDDEEATVRTLTTYRTAISDLVQQFRGRVIDTPGDNILTEFPSVVDAVNCAVEIQRELSKRNAELAYNRKMEFRIGINLGDVIEEDGRIYGDGVNIAARVESLADAGGICISSRAYDQVANKLGLGYEDLGDHKVKNISQPIKVFRVFSDPDEAAHSLKIVSDATKRKARSLFLSLLAIIVVSTVAWYWTYINKSPEVVPANIEKMAFALPDKPSLAILPFINLSDNPEHEIISDALTDDIISALSHKHELFVIDRHSSSTYKGKSATVQTVAEELGVQYVLEGSVQKSEEEVRISTQLVDAISGEFIWTERYKRPYKDLFALEDDITLNIMKSLQGKLFKGIESSEIRDTESLEAWLLFQKGLKHGGTHTKDGTFKSKEFYEKALEIDPDFLSAIVGLGWKHWQIATKGFTESSEESFEKAIDLAKHAIEINPNSAGANGLMVGIHMWKREYEQALKLSQKTIELDPNNSESHAILGWVLIANMQPSKAIEQFEIAMRLSPYYPKWFLNVMIRAYVLAGKYEKAIAASEEMINRKAGNFFTGQAHLNSAVAYSSLGQSDKAKAEMTKALEIHPQLTVNFIKREVNCTDESFLTHYFDTLRELELPE